MKNNTILLLILLLNISISEAQENKQTYTNPIIFADYSDPDAIRVGEDYYMTSSSFSHFPALPILHSKDLVNWNIIAYAVENYPFPEFEKPQHGDAVWAPSIRYHNNEFYIYYGDPDRGVFMTKAKNAAGPWEPLKCIKKVTGWIDCCPFWDEDGKAYLVHAFANSRSGIKSVIAMNQMNPEGTEVLDYSIIVFDGHENHNTIEGPKMYKRNGYYYIFAPAGGVKPGWQTILRSKNVYGPYEDKITLEQGSTNINGPHQGAWIDTPTGEDWFIHFQDRYAYGRLVLLQPMKWENDWPVMGIDYDQNGIGEPVEQYTKPNTNASPTLKLDQVNDDFNNQALGLQWQWCSNYKPSWYSLGEKKGSLRLLAQAYEKETDNLWNVGNLLLQKLPALKFSATTKIDLSASEIGEKAGLLVFGMDYSYISIEKNKKGYTLSHVICTDAHQGNKEEIIETVSIQGKEIYFNVSVSPKNEKENIPVVICTFSYSVNNQNFKPLGKNFIAKEGKWVGAKVGVFAISPQGTKKTGYADVDWFKIE